MTPPPPAFFKDPATEALVATVVALASEVYVLRERMARMEAAHPPAPLDRAAEAALRKDADDYVQHVFGALMTTPRPGAAR
jgi:hypothetical protein